MMEDDSESKVTDILVEKKISSALIRDILLDAFNINEDSILILQNSHEPYKEDLSNIHCLCLTSTLRGDVSLLLTLYRYTMSNELALQRLIRSFMKFRVSSYFVKDNFDDFYHVDESGSLVIATQVYDDNDDNVFHFEVKEP